MPALSTYKQETISVDETGQEHITTVERTSKIERSTEPDYIKLYTKMWCEFNNIPTAYRDLFYELAARMSYCNATDIDHSQLVNTGKPWADDIMHTLGWKRSMYQTGLRTLCRCGAIKQVARGVYQINPQYAGRGEWKYNPRLQRGGVEDLVAKFCFKDKQVQTSIVWADDGTDTPLNETYRQGMQVQAHDHAVLKETTAVPAKSDDDGDPALPFEEVS